MTAHTAKEGGIVDQYKLLRAAIDADWSTGLDHRVVSHVVDRYFAKHGNSRVSLRYLEEATGATRTNVIASLRRIEDNGVFSVQRLGAGTRPTEYLPNWRFGGSGIAHETSSSEDSSGIVHDTSSGPVYNTSTPPSGIVYNTKTDLPLTGLQPGLEVSNVSAVPSAPPADGRSATAAASAGFERVWAAYGKHGSKKAARAAFDALSEPDVDHIVGRAASWAASAKPGRRRMPLEKWLTDERFDEADRRTTSARGSRRCAVVERVTDCGNGWTEFAFTWGSVRKGQWNPQSVMTRSTDQVAEIVRALNITEIAEVEGRAITVEFSPNDASIQTWHRAPDANDAKKAA